ncbi:MAG: glutamate synthase [Oscillospiraceae bacterium]|jgi:glutamate synthase domain-containing protein 3|nr:glutamate synthase [Oscillospiraceae bacterium]
MSTILSARELGFQPLNEAVRASVGEIIIDDCYGERFIAASATNDKRIIINGTPGNALGCYLDGARILVNGNAQDAVGDTMNDGEIVIHGRAGDALGYAMRGGVIYVKGDSGYRTGIHMKQYLDKRPVIVVGGGTGSFLGEYMAGGLLIVLGLNALTAPNIGSFVGTGMHGGKIFIRSDTPPEGLPAQVACERATPGDVASVSEYLKRFASLFGADANELLGSAFHVLTPNSANPYHQMYTAN